MKVKERIAEFEALDAQILVVAYVSPEYCQGFRDHLGLPFEVASSPDRKIYDDYGLSKGSFFTVWHPRVLWSHVKIIFDHKKTLGHGYKPPTGEDDLYQLGADFVIDAEGVVRWTYYCKSPDDRPPVEDLLAALAPPGVIPASSTS